MRLAYRSFIPTLLSAVLMWSTPASAWDGIVTGKIGSIDVNSGNYFDFRVNVEGIISNACGPGTESWVYLNQADSNYQVFVSILTTAYATGKTISASLTNDAGSSYCHISYLTVAG